MTLITAGRIAGNGLLLRTCTRGVVSFSGLDAKEVHLPRKFLFFFVRVWHILMHFLCIIPTTAGAKSHRLRKFAWHSSPEGGRGLNLHPAPCTLCLLMWVENLKALNVECAWHLVDNFSALIFTSCKWLLVLFTSAHYTMWGKKTTFIMTLSNLAQLW